MKFARAILPLTVSLSLTACASMFPSPLIKVPPEKAYTSLIKAQNPPQNKIQAGIAEKDVGKYMDDLQKDIAKMSLPYNLQQSIKVEKQADNSLHVRIVGVSVFTPSMNTVNAEATPIFAQIANVLQRHDKTAVHVIGFTDSSGSAWVNLRRSEKRAQNVAEILYNNGVDASRIMVGGRGENNPIADNNSDNGRSANRRVELFIKPIIAGHEQDAMASLNFPDNKVEEK
jgi:outer membrane protein OmpA-like peptidoglycan-associated protein